MNELFNKKYRIPTARASWWDYSQNGVYFVTICTQNKKLFFGDIVDDNMNLSEIGKIAYRCWEEIPQHFPFVLLDAFVIMPNHIHGVIIIDKKQPSIFNPHNQFAAQSENLAGIIRGYKAGVSSQAKNINPYFKWQTRFHDHIIRNSNSYTRITNYIQNNPFLWKDDKFHPEANTPSVNIVTSIDVNTGIDINTHVETHICVSSHIQKKTETQICVSTE